MKYIDQFAGALKASRTLNMLSESTINLVLNELADEAVRQTGLILSENEKDLARMQPTDPKYDRLKLTPERLAAIASDIRNVATLPSPLGKVLSDDLRSNGLSIRRVSVPFGVIGVIYEARPNVTFDVFSLCLKSGNVAVLKGGSDADDSNRAIAGVIRQVLEKYKIDPNCLVLLPADREATSELLHAHGYVDLLIPRGSQGLIDFVRQNATIPVIETGAGICHTYFDRDGDLEKGRAIVNNAKTRRVSVCNALDCLIIHNSRLGDLAGLISLLPESNVIVYADEASYAALEGNYPQHLLLHATETSFGTEFLDYKMAIKTVAAIDDAIEHIEQHSSKHSEAIISENPSAIDLFLKRVDASSVYANASTAFTDGAQFGLGAEIGISTQKLHARGPMALEALTSYKWLVVGDGQIRGK